MRKMYEKYKEMILYLFFGGCTTLVNIVSYYIAAHLLHMPVIPATAAAWLVSVLFAYVTNKIWVFESKTDTVGQLVTECLTFIGCRAASGGLDLLIMWLGVSVLHFQDMLIKIIANIVVVIVNYAVSKFLIFKK